LRRTVETMPTDAEFARRLEEWRAEALKDGYKWEINAAEECTPEDMKRSWVAIKETLEMFYQNFPDWFENCDCSSQVLIRSGCRCGGRLV
jgi:hypothetical protein